MWEPRLLPLEGIKAFQLLLKVIGLQRVRDLKLKEKPAPLAFCWVAGLQCSIWKAHEKTAITFCADTCDNTFIHSILFYTHCILNSGSRGSRLEPFPALGDSYLLTLKSLQCKICRWVYVYASRHVKCWQVKVCSIQTGAGVGVILCGAIPRYGTGAMRCVWCGSVRYGYWTALTQHFPATCTGPPCALQWPLIHSHSHTNGWLLLCKVLLGAI